MSLRKKELSLFLRSLTRHRQLLKAMVRELGGSSSSSSYSSSYSSYSSYSSSSAAYSYGGDDHGCGKHTLFELVHYGTSYKVL